MFKKNGKNKPAASATNVTVINKGTVVEGEVEVDGTIRIYGQLNGTVRSEGKVIIAEDGHLSGDLHANAAEISGTVEGVIEATRLDLRSTATVEGNVVVETFTTENGAIFMGECKMPQGGVMPPPKADDDEDAEALTDTDDPAGEVPAPEDAADEVERDASEDETSAADDVPTVEPVATPVDEDENNGVKPLPSKPSADAPDAEPVDSDAADASSDGTEARPRFW